MEGNMNRAIKTAIFVFAVFLLVTAFTGCKKGTSGTTSQSFTFTGYPMNAKDQTITWFGGEGYMPNAAYANADQSPFHSGLKDMLGVDIKWDFPIAGTNQAQAINLILASGELPDVMFGGGLMNNAARYIEEETFLDLTPHLQEWSPAYWKWLHSNPAYDRAMKTDDGKYYGYGFFREDGGWNDTYLGPVVNKTWLDECGLPPPQTISDWDRTLRAFKQRYGATLSFAWSRVSGYGTLLSGAFGAYSFADYKLYVDKNSKIQLANVQPEYRAQLVKMNEWWREGLIDQDFLSITDTMARSNALNKKMGISYTSMGQLSNWVMDAQGANNGANWIGLQFPKGDDGTLVMVPGGYGIGSVVAAITSNVKSPEKLQMIMRALDYAYTDEGNLYWNYGKKGVSWDYGPDGKPAYLPLVTEDPNGLNGAIDKYGGSTWSGNCIQATALLYMKNTQQAIDANDLWFYPNKDISAAWTLPNGMTLTTEESTRAGEIRASISTYVNETSIQFLTGQANFNTWDAYVARVNSMGLPELLRIYQAAYDRYLKR
jgi:putative aldouronate transport system substrate-binding protein